jgi:hypothetical protein
VLLLPSQTLVAARCRRHQATAELQGTKAGAASRRQLSAVLERLRQQQHPSGDAFGGPGGGETVIAPGQYADVLLRALMENGLEGSGDESKSDDGNNSSDSGDGAGSDSSGDDDAEGHGGVVGLDSGKEGRDGAGVTSNGARRGLSRATIRKLADKVQRYTQLSCSFVAFKLARRCIAVATLRLAPTSQPSTCRVCHFTLARS